MILTGSAIAEAFEQDHIRILPWSPEQLGPNSYDVRLGPEVWTYDRDRIDTVLDSKKRNRGRYHQIGEAGFIVRPGQLYLMHTIERIWSDRYVPQIDGKSSIGRLGIAVHVTAGRGDTGFDGQYTLEVFSVAHSVRLYAGMRIGQVFFHAVQGEPQDYSVNGNYVGETSRGPVPSRSWRQFET